MSRYDHKIETSLEGIEHLSKEKKEKKVRKMKSLFGYYRRLASMNLGLQKTRWPRDSQPMNQPSTRIRNGIMAWLLTLIAPALFGFSLIYWLELNIINSKIPI